MFFIWYGPRMIMSKKQTYAFTLIEIMLVIIIIGILTAIVGTRFTGKTTQARIAATKAEINGTIAMALDLYELDAGSFPNTSQSLKALIEKPSTPPEPNSWKGPYLKKSVMPKDQWNHEYIYKSPGDHNQDYDLSSMGPDGVAGNEDDINNWDKEENQTKE